MASVHRNVLLSALFVLFGGPGIVLFFLPIWITHFHIPKGEPWWQMLFAALLIAVGLLPALESVRRFIFVGQGTLIPIAPPQHLVVSGFYRYVRNPMYVGVMVALAGEAILFWSRGIVVEAVCAFVGFNMVICLHEEPALARNFTDEYLHYKKNVPRWLPRITPWSGSNS
jgi:Putative protein-S-isoprenylcysteine methyltransferase